MDKISKEGRGLIEEYRHDPSVLRAIVVNLTVTALLDELEREVTRDCVNRDSCEGPWRDIIREEIARRVPVEAS